MASPSSIKTPTSIMSGPATSPNRRQRPPRPKITLNIPPPNASSTIQSPFTYPPPQSAMSGGTNLSGYPHEDNFMNQLGDFTKAGLGHGERVAVWIYDRFSKWSKKWFTHIFLALVMILFSLVIIILILVSLFTLEDVVGGLPSN